MRAHHVLATGLIVLALLAGCGSETDEPTKGDAPADGPRTLQPVGPDADAPKGYHRVVCSLTTAERELEVSLVVPRGSEEAGQDDPPDNTCYYVTPDGPPIRVLLLNGDPDVNDAQDVDSLEGVHDGFDERYGEDEPHSVVWEQDQPVLGDTLGDRLYWDSSYEGEPTRDLRVEADGVQVWTSGQPDEKFFDTVTASVGLAP